ncbi:uncharacterized protein IUM83_11609 [Phytophthora cinnamomi]|uniref:uncharacterized protein n=1 Tax=Phytophthora cinnamomi TaxID=4785 RepID=UPI003559B29E|nr:hypothetical protein IUM83_11609 [Phytophthora cinnamomi]
MSETEDVCGCLVCAVLCGVCCVAAAEEDKRERERAAAEALQLKNPGVVVVNPVAVPTPYSQLQKQAKVDAVEVPKEPSQTTPEPAKKKKHKTKEGKTHKQKAGSKRRRGPPSY